MDSLLSRDESALVAEMERMRVEEEEARRRRRRADNGVVVASEGDGLDARSKEAIKQSRMALQSCRILRAIG